MSELLHQNREPVAGAEQVSAGAVFTPSVDIYETDQELVLVADLPGVKQKDLSINLENEILTLEGSISALEAGPEGKLLLQEYENGRYFRQFTLGQSINRAGIVAKLKGGELVLTLPKAAAAQPQRINISGE